MSHLRTSAVLIGCLLIATRGVLWAHAALISSEPAARAVMTHTPSRIRLVFSEPVDASVSGIQLVAANVGARDLVVRSDPNDARALIAVTDSLGPAEYRVSWRTVSVDGHKVSGTFVFTVRGDTTTRAASALPPPPEDTVSTTATLVGAPAIAAPLRGIALACIMALAGLLFFSFRARVGTARATTLADRLSVAALILAVAHFVAWTINTSPDHRFGLGWMRAVGNTSSGHMEIARLVAVALAVIALVGLRRPLAAFAFAASALVISAAIGHPAAMHPLIAIPSTAVHLVAGALWLGGLLWLIAAGRDDLERYALEARRVSRLAFVSVVVVAATGILQTGLIARASLDVVHTTYGKIVIAKIIGLFVLVGFGAFHRRNHLPRLSDAPTGARLRDSIRFEVGVFILVVLFAGLLSYVPPRGDQTTIPDMPSMKAMPDMPSSIHLPARR